MHVMQFLYKKKSKEIIQKSVLTSSKTQQPKINKKCALSKRSMKFECAKNTKTHTHTPYGQQQNYILFDQQSIGS